MPLCVCLPSCYWLALKKITCRIYDRNKLDAKMVKKFGVDVQIKRLLPHMVEDSWRRSVLDSVFQPVDEIKIYLGKHKIFTLETEEGDIFL